MIITDSQLKGMLPHNKDFIEWLDPLNKVLPQYDINTKNRIAAFVAQTAHESNDYTRLVENLNYSAKGLMATWPSRFRVLSFAEQYARNPEKIANYVYCGRLGNSTNLLVGDGWRFRGRGIMQITGKENYLKCSISLFGDDRLVQNPDLLTDKPIALAAACWYWNSRKLNNYADEGDNYTISVKINGGEIGLKDRNDRFSANLILLGE